MAVFVSASDENSGRTERDTFLFAGWVAPEEDWSHFFAPAWQERVLDGPPAIPFLHMTEIRSKGWRSKYGLSRLQAEDRLDEAFNLIDTMQSLYPVGVSVDAGLVRDNFATARVVGPKGRGAKAFDPDYICFLGYAFYALMSVATNHPEATKVDFIVERKGHITEYIGHFHSTIAANLKALGHPHLASLVGELIPASKDRIPLQAADVLCWHTARYEHPETMDAIDLRRYAKIAKRNGARWRLKREQISQMASALLS